MPDSDKDAWQRFYFDDWVEREGLDLIKGTRVDDVYSVPLKPWARLGGKGVHIMLDGTGDLNACYVAEISPGKHLEPEKHIYEEMIYVLRGRGSASVWVDEKRKQTFEWKAGSLFSIPLNAWHQLFNGSGTEPARIWAVTCAPIMMNLMRDDDAIFNNDAVFPERFSGEEDYFSRDVEMVLFSGWGKPTQVAFSNFIADINSIPFEESSRGKGVVGMSFDMANGVTDAHTLVIPPGRFTKMHRHGPGAHVLWLTGEGYSIMFPDGGEMVREDWQRGTMLVPPDWWWHNHNVVSKEPGQHFAIHLNSKKRSAQKHGSGVLKSTKEGGSQLNFEDMPPDLAKYIFDTFVEECGKRGTPVIQEPLSAI